MKKRDKDKLTFLRNRINVARNREVPKEVKVTAEYLFKIGQMQGWRCNLSGRWLTFIKTGSKYDRTLTNCSIDRISSNRGYVHGNIQLVCWEDNNRKRTMSNYQYKKRMGYI